MKYRQENIITQRVNVKAQTLLVYNIRKGNGGISMSLEEKLLQDFITLPEDKKIEVIDFVEFLKSKTNQPLESIMDTIINENQEALRELAK
jgi:hypothetical protein